MDKLELKHANMRKKDWERIKNREATPEEVQKENAMFKFTEFKILNFTY